MVHHCSVRDHFNCADKLAAIKCHRVAILKQDSPNTHAACISDQGEPLPPLRELENRGSGKSSLDSCKSKLMLMFPPPNSINF